MPKTAETINPLDYLYPEKDLASQKLKDYPTDQILNKNLEALKKVNPKLANTIDCTDIPDNYQLTVTTDGNFSFKIFDQEQTSHWPAKRSAPAIAAQADIIRQDLELSNVAIHSLGDGYTIREILKQLQPFQALFVIEENPINIKTALCIHDFSIYIENGQLAIIHGPEPFQTLTEFLINNKGYQLIEKSLYLYEFSEQQNKVFTSKISAAVEKAYENVISDLNTTSKELAGIKSNIFDLARPDNLNVINIPDFLNPKAYILSRDILAGFAANGLNTHHNLFDSPRYASTIMQTKKYIEQSPDAIVMINNIRTTAKYKFPASTPIISILTDINKDIVDSLDTSNIAPHDIIACEKQSTNHFPDNVKNNLIEFEKHVNTDIYFPLGEDEIHNICNNSQEYAKHDVVIITERTAINPTAYNVKLNSQVDLISACCAAIAKDPAGYNKSLNKMYFENGQKKSGVKITDNNLRESLLAIFSEIAKAVIIDTYSLEMINAGFDIAAYHFDQHFPKGFSSITDNEELLLYWENSPLLNYIKGKVCDSPKLNTINNCGKIFICMYNDGIPDQIMLNIIASGGFVLTKAHPKDNKKDGLKSIFEPGKDIITYTGTNDLCRKVEYYLNNNDKRIEISDNARQKLIQNRTAKQFCKMILQKLSQS